MTDDKALSRGYSNDMSPEAIMRRLEIVNELYQFGKLLSSAKSLGRVEDLKSAAAAQSTDQGFGSSSRPAAGK